MVNSEATSYSKKLKLNRKINLFIITAMAKELKKGPFFQFSVSGVLFIIHKLCDPSHCKCMALYISDPFSVKMTKHKH